MSELTKLRELDSTWREAAEVLRHKERTIPIAAALLECADSLRDLLSSLEQRERELLALLTFPKVCSHDEEPDYCVCCMTDFHRNVSKARKRGTNAV